MKFRDDYWFLSNMYPCKVTVNGYTFSCAEAAFQAGKCRTKAEVWAFTQVDGFTAKRMGRRIHMRDDWNTFRVTHMKRVLVEKFSNPVLYRKLKKTGDVELVEENDWNDTFWGVCNGYGKNMLGKLLMEIRDV